MRELSAAVLGNALRSGGAVLDAGCGTGGYLRFLLDERDFSTAAGVDLGAAAIELAQTRVPEADLRVAPLRALPFGDETFDLVVSNDVLQHVDEGELEESLAELRRVLRPGGIAAPADERLVAAARRAERLARLRPGDAATPARGRRLRGRARHPCELRPLAVGRAARPAAARPVARAPRPADRRGAAAACPRRSHAAAARGASPRRGGCHCRSGTRCSRSPGGPRREAGGGARGRGGRDRGRVPRAAGGRQARPCRRPRRDGHARRPDLDARRPSSGACAPAARASARCRRRTRRSRTCTISPQRTSFTVGAAAARSSASRSDPERLERGAPRRAADAAGQRLHARAPRQRRPRRARTHEHRAAAGPCLHERRREHEHGPSGACGPGDHQGRHRLAADLHDRGQRHLRQRRRRRPGDPGADRPPRSVERLPGRQLPRRRAVPARRAPHLAERHGHPLRGDGNVAATRATAARPRRRSSTSRTPSRCFPRATS